MKNILSFRPGTKFLGKEIKEWVNYQCENNTSHKKMAQFIRDHYANISDNKYYTILLSYHGTGCGEVIRKKPLLQKCN